MIRSINISYLGSCGHNLLPICQHLSIVHKCQTIPHFFWIYSSSTCCEVAPTFFVNLSFVSIFSCFHGYLFKIVTSAEYISFWGFFRLLRYPSCLSQLPCNLRSDVPKFYQSLHALKVMQLLNLLSRCHLSHHRR